MKKVEKKGESEKHTNYKNLITQYYNKDPMLSDAIPAIEKSLPEI